MTEDDASKVWCPFVRHTSTEDNACLGSKCAAWRWLPLQADEAFKNAVIKAKDDINDKSDAGIKAAKHVMANRSAYGLPTEPFEGYCGLAGKP